MRIVVPPSMRADMLSQIHASHLGIVKCKQCACEALYWPGMSEQITNLVQDCHLCNTIQNRQHAEPLKPTNLPDLPWNELAYSMWRGADASANHQNAWTCKGSSSVVLLQIYLMRSSVQWLNKHFLITIRFCLFKKKETCDHFSYSIHFFVPPKVNGNPNWFICFLVIKKKEEKGKTQEIQLSWLNVQFCSKTSQRHRSY